VVPAALLAAALATLPVVPPWLALWTVAGALFHGLKWTTWRQASRAGLVRSRGRTVAWFLLWAGMDARAWFDEARRPERPRKAEAVAALAKTAVGAVVLWGLARGVSESQPLLRGWVGLFGFAWFLLFGVLHLLSVGWRCLGVDAPPLWRSPLLARSLGDFWGNRWNLAFRDAARTTLFAPLRRRRGTAVAVAAVFLASGLAHDLVLSVPARGGYGWPTAFFLFQAVGVALDGSSLGRRLGLRGGRRGRALALLWTGPTAFVLFHPPFVERVWVPFLAAIGALGV
jgi:alginate O-acetyltransferase complex protein AlgI